MQFPPTRSRAPLRLGLAGGGTDLSPFSETHGGAVLNCTIDRYAFAFLEARSDNRIVFQANDLQQQESCEDMDAVARSQLALHRGVYLRIMRDFNGGRAIPMTITTSVDAPMGSGLGTSSAIVVALIEAFRTLLDLPLGQYDVAHLAYEIERIDLAGGKQDQYAAAFGGLNFIEFLSADRVIVNPLRIPNWIAKELESSLVLVFSGQSRSSATIIDQQTSRMTTADETAMRAWAQLKADAIEMKSLLLRGDLQGFAKILGKSWLAKKATAPNVSNARIEELFVIASSNGALSGKVSGAGGGGFLMFLVEPQNRLNLIQALRDVGAEAEPVKFTTSGCESWQIKN